jgi:hypothetical protein
MKNNYTTQHLATSKIFFACIICFLLAGISTTASAQVTVSGCGAGNGDGSYTELTTAFSAINNKVQTGKNIIITLTAGYTTNNTATLNAGAWTTLKIYPTVSNITITNSSNSLIVLNGADKVTIDGRVNQTGSTCDLSLVTTSQNSVSNIQFINSATLNTIKYCTLKGNSNEATCGLIFFSTNNTGNGNDNNTIDNCNFTSTSDANRPTYTIYSAGTLNKDNTGNTISNNNFYNLWNPERPSYDIYVKEYSSTFTISGNQFYEAGTVPSGSGSFSFINITAGNGHTITNNYMGGTAPLCGGAAMNVTFAGQSTLISFIPINLSVTTTTATLVDGNTISNINFLSTNPEFSAIKVTAGVVTISNNTIGSSTGTQSIKLITDEQNDERIAKIINITAPNNVTISNNIIGSIYTTNTYTSSLQPYSLFGIYKSNVAGNLTITGNTIGSETTANSIQAASTTSSKAQTLMGIYCAGSGTNTITGNTIANLVNSCTYYNAQATNIFINQAIGTYGGTNTISQNTIHDLYGQMLLIGGIFQQSTSSASQTVAYNTIYNIKNTLSDAQKAAGNYGIYFDGTGNQWSTVTNNYVYNLTVSSNNSGCSIDGIDLMSGKVYCYNNIVNLGENESHTTMIYGIWDNGTSGTNQIYHNTAYISGSTSSGIIRTAAFYRGGNNSTTDLKNNIFVNTRSGGSGGKHYSAYVIYTGNFTADYNDYYVNGANSAFGNYAGNDFTAADIISYETNSKVIAAPFKLTPTTLATDFKLTTQMAGLAGTMLTTVPNDYGRTGIRTTPTMGAWEFKKNYWKGSTNVTTGTTWTTLANWTGGYIPSEDEDVEFADGTANTVSPAAANHLLLDTDRKIRNLIINTNKRIEIPTGKRLDVTGTISTGTNTDRILIKSASGAKNGSLIFPNATDVYGSVEMYSKAKMNPNPDPTNQSIFDWQYFGIPVQTIKPNPTLDGAYVRKSIENGTENDDNYLWKEMGNNDDLTAFDGYEICQPSPTTYTFSGKLVNWDKLSGQLACTSTAAYPGQHLFANPYTAAIDIKKLVFGPDMEWSVFLYNTGSYANWQASGGVNTSGEGAGQYISIPQSRAGLSGIPSEVPSMSSMLIKTPPGVSTADSYLNIIYKDVVKKNETIQRVKKADGVTNTDVISTKIDLTGEHYSDRMWIFTDPTCTRNYDNGWDGRKMLGSSLAPQIYAVEPDGDYQVNSVNDMHDTDIAFQPGDEVEYTLKFTHENIQRQYAGVYLVDMVENKTIDVTQNGSTYKFATAQSDVPTKRFKIITRHYEKNAPDTESQLKIFSAKSSVYIQNSGILNGDCTLYNIAGQAVRRLSFGPGSLTTVSNLRQGAYVISATTNGEKVSKRVIVQ